MKILDKEIGPANPVYIIAELSANHHHSYERAEELLIAAKDCGADAAKLQTFTADSMTLASSDKPFLISGGTTWDGRTLHDLYREAEMPWEWQERLSSKARELGIHLFSTPFDAAAVDFLQGLDVPAYKIASFELVDHPLLARVAATKRPVIMSTGMATLAEIDESVAVLRSHGCEHLVLLKCTSAYPALASEANLRTMQHLAETFGVPAGLSDHTLDLAVPVAAAALGACVIEKHLTTSRADSGPDSSFSLEPVEFRQMVDQVRIAEEAVGKVNYDLSEREKRSREFRRSLFVIRDVAEGELFHSGNVRVIRPGCGLAPKFLNEILGRRAARPLKRGTPLTWECLS